MRLLGGPLDAMLPMVTDEVRGLDRVLELAAGTGLVTAAMAPAVGEVLATDYAEGMVAALDARVAELGFDNVQTRQLDVYALVEDGVFDAVVAANVMHLLPDVDGAMATIRRALRPGGRLVIPTYCHDETVISRLVSRIIGLLGFPGRRRLTLDRLEALLAAHGFRVRKRALLPGLLPIGFVSGRLVEVDEKGRQT
ncbi:MAG: class I SAM-dependent methyltransferase [Alphaproteobacteria bacterium]|nr:class I SAM-dependent methyltransferase [Alphaproteobacteria bacterium]